jgi:hypothetical protein
MFSLCFTTRFFHAPEQISLVREQVVTGSEYIHQPRKQTLSGHGNKHGARTQNGTENGLLPNLNSTSFQTRKQTHSKLQLLGLLSLKIDSIRAPEETELEIRCIRRTLIDPLTFRNLASYI